MFSAIPDFRAAKALRRPRILAQIAGIVFTLLAPATALSQGVNYSVEIEAPGKLDDLLEDNLDLLRWRDNPRLDIDQLQRLVKAAPEQARQLIATEGFYAPKVSAGLDTSGARPVARIFVDPGPPTLVGDVDLVLKGFEQTGDGDNRRLDPEELRNNWTLPVGAVFRQEDWEAAKGGLLRRVIQTRYPRAQLTESSAVVDPDVSRALLKVVLDSGPEARFGEVRIEGLQRYPASIVLNLNRIRPGSVYRASALQDYQAKLQDTGYFSGVEVSIDPGETLDAQIAAIEDKQDNPDAPPARPVAPAEKEVTVPILVRVTENKQRNVAVGLGFSSNTGARAQVTYDDLNVRGLRMKSNVLFETRRQSARADFYFPTTQKGYNDSFGGGFERNDMQSEVTAVATLAARRNWGTPRRERSLTLEFLHESRTVEDQPETISRSLPLTFSYTRRAVDNLLLPTRGYVANATLAGALLPLLTDRRFLRASVRGIYYRPLGPASTLVLRGEAGALGSSDKEGIPGTFLFRAGGDQSVRGYAYQSLGVKEGEATVGGRYLLTGSAEYQYWFKPPWGVAFFYDAGNAADRVKDLKPESGYGVGARWRSPVGPINVDLAYGQATKEARVHFSLGFTF